MYSYFKSFFKESKDNKENLVEHDYQSNVNNSNMAYSIPKQSNSRNSTPPAHQTSMEIEDIEMTSSDKVSDILGMDLDQLDSDTKIELIHLLQKMHEGKESRKPAISTFAANKNDVRFIHNEASDRLASKELNRKRLLNNVSDFSETSNESGTLDVIQDQGNAKRARRDIRAPSSHIAPTSSSFSTSIKATGGSIISDTDRNSLSGKQHTAVEAATRVLLQATSGKLPKYDVSASKMVRRNDSKARGNIDQRTIATINSNSSLISASTISSNESNSAFAVGANLSQPRNSNISRLNLARNRYYSYQSSNTSVSRRQPVRWSMRRSHLRKAHASKSNNNNNNNMKSKIDDTSVKKRKVVSSEKVYVSSSTTATSLPLNGGIDSASNASKSSKPALLGVMNKLNPATLTTSASTAKEPITKKVTSSDSKKTVTTPAALKMSKSSLVKNVEIVFNATATTTANVKTKSLRSDRGMSDNNIGKSAVTSVTTAAASNTGGAAVMKETSTSNQFDFSIPSFVEIPPMLNLSDVVLKESKLQFVFSYPNSSNVTKDVVNMSDPLTDPIPMFTHNSVIHNNPVKSKIDMDTTINNNNSNNNLGIQKLESMIDVTTSNKDISDSKNYTIISSDNRDISTTDNAPTKGLLNGLGDDGMMKAFNLDNVKNISNGGSKSASKLLFKFSIPEIKAVSTFQDNMMVTNKDSAVSSFQWSIPNAVPSA